MKRFRNYFLRMILLLIPCVLLALSGAPSEAAVLEQYCQYPPYVVQTVLPSVTILVSNSQSMLNFAYGDGVNGCKQFVESLRRVRPKQEILRSLRQQLLVYRRDRKQWGLHEGDPGGRDVGGAHRQGGNDWHGNFLNWLTTRRVDVMRKVLTGGTGNGTESCGANGALYKKFSDNGKYTPVTAPTIL